MPKHRGAGVLVVFEGIDGAGKTTQAARLTSVLKESGQAVVSSKEPTNGPWGQIIRESARNGRLAPAEELNAFIKDREQHVRELILPALDQGKIVILDRYYYSTLAYQGARGIQVLETKALMEQLFPIPDAVFFLDIDPELSIERIANRGELPNSFERLDNLEATRSVFLSIDDSNIVRINGMGSIEEVHNEVLRQFLRGPLRVRRCAKENGCEDPAYCSHRLAGTCRWASIAEQVSPPIMHALVFSPRS